MIKEDKKQVCAEELLNWLLKWIREDSGLDPEIVLGLLESLKFVYLHSAYKNANIKI